MDTECKTKRIRLLQFEEVAAMNSSASADTTFAKNMYPQIIFSLICIFVDIINTIYGLN
jgi:hypothetical protein